MTQWVECFQASVKTYAWISGTYVKAGGHAVSESNLSTPVGGSKAEKGGSLERWFS